MTRASWDDYLASVIEAQRTLPYGPDFPPVPFVCARFIDLPDTQQRNPKVSHGACKVCGEPVGFDASARLMFSEPVCVQCFNGRCDELGLARG